MFLPKSAERGLVDMKWDKIKELVKSFIHIDFPVLCLSLSLSL